jgi:hypothetical protein
MIDEPAPEPRKVTGAREVLRESEEVATPAAFRTQRLDEVAGTPGDCGDVNVRVVPELVGLEAVAGDAALTECGGKADFFSDRKDAFFNGPRDVLELHESWRRVRAPGLHVVFGRIRGEVLGCAG